MYEFKYNPFLDSEKKHEKVSMGNPAYEPAFYHYQLAPERKRKRDFPWWIVLVGSVFIFLFVLWKHKKEQMIDVLSELLPKETSYRVQPEKSETAS